jgi:ABC-type sugar transport system ATPase subunit
MNLIAGVIGPDGKTFLAAEGNLAITIPAEGRPAGLVSGLAVLLGLRPEALRFGSAGSAGFPALVEEVEPLGNETLVNLNAGGTLITLRLEGGALPRRGEKVNIELTAEALHWFDGATQARLP